MFKNLTPHELNIVTADGILDVPASGTVARCSQREISVDIIHGVEITRQVFGAVVDLPEPEDGTYYIVSRIVAAACEDRDDLLIPGPLVRDDAGNVIGCKGLSVL